MGGSAERDVMAHCVPFQRPCQKPLLWLHPQDWNHKMKRPGKARLPKHLERILRESVSRDGFGSAVTTSRDCPGAVGRGCAGDALSLTASLASGGAPGAGTADGAELKGVETAPWVMGASGEAGKPGTMGSCSARQQMARGKVGHGTWCCCWVCSEGGGGFV